MSKFVKNNPYPFFGCLLLVLSVAFVILGLTDIMPKAPALHEEREYKMEFISDNLSNISYSDASADCKLDIIAPANHDSLLPVIVYYHGGGWIAGDKNDYTNFCQRVADKGFLVVNVNYRLLNKADFPAFLQDAVNAYLWTCSNIPTYGGDSSNIFLCGDSAGGHIAALCANALTNPDFTDECGTKNAVIDNIRGAGLLCGVYDIPLMAQLSFAKIMADNLLKMNSIKSAYEKADILTVTGNISKNYPPCFITTCYYDPLNNQVEPFINCLEQNGIKYDALIYDASHTDLGHCYQVYHFEESDECINRMTDFFLSCCI